MVWIRSQNGRLLIKARSVYYDTVVRYSIGSKPCHTLMANGASVGTFATEEAALAELDRIVIWISNSALGVFKVASDEHFSD